MSGMNDDRLSGLLGQLRNERMDRVADDKIRARLENAWTAREQQRGFGWRFRRLAPVLATVVLFAGIAGATLNASGDSVLYGIRIAVEDAAVALHTDPEDRNEYLLSLLTERQDEAARLESSGNALAASHVRQVEQQTLQRLMAQLPQAPDDNAAVQPAPTETPTSAPTATPSASPTPSPTPIPTAVPTAVRTVTPTEPVHTPTPTVRTPSPTPTPVRTTAPTPAPTGSPMAVTITGLLKNPDGTPAANACVFQSSTSFPPTTCLTYTRSDGTYQLVVSARLNQIVSIYFYRADGTVAYKANAQKMVTGTTVTMPITYLQK